MSESPPAKKNIQRPAFQATGSQQRDRVRRARPGRRLLGALPLPAGARQAVVTLDEVPVHLTHLDKIYFPNGPPGARTKRDLLDYNHDVAEFLLPHLRDRPYTMKRFPDGIAGPPFFQKEAGSSLPAAVPTIALPSGGKHGAINYALCNDCPTLLTLVNLGCIDHNVWMSRASTPETPDFVLLDLDPGAQTPFAKVVRVAIAIRGVLEAAEIAAFLKTSGATGLHVFIPLAPGATFAQSQLFAALLLRLAAQRVPELVTEVWQVNRRPQDRVYLDYRQNAHGKTIPPPYSPRPHAGAPVSTPLLWRELTSRLDPAQFNLRTMRRRLERRGDLFAGALPSAPAESLAALLERLEPRAA